MSVLSEFKEFAVKGNMIDMAVGIIIGGAFGKVVTSLVNDVIMPPLGVLLGGTDFSELAVTLKAASKTPAGVDVPAVLWKYGSFIQTMVDFLIVAWAVFMLVKGINTLRRMTEYKRNVAALEATAAPDAPAAQPAATEPVPPPAK